MKINKKLENAFDILDSINETKEELQELAEFRRFIFYGNTMW